MNDTPYSTEPEIPAWARDLEAMRHQRKVVQEMSASAADTVNQDSATGKTVLPPESSFAAASEEEREFAYQRYLQSWQRQHNLTVENNHHSTVHVLFGEEWQRESREILERDNGCEEQSMLLKLDIDPATVQEFPLGPAKTNTRDMFVESPVQPFQAASYHVKVMAPPVGRDMRVALMDEKTLMRQLDEKLRPHLNDAVAGVVKTTIQRHLHTLVNQLQQEIPQELGNVIGEVLQLHLEHALDEIKSTAGIVKKVS